MKCTNCKSILHEVNVAVEGSRHPVKSFQCTKCDYVTFEQESANRVLLELKAQDTPLRIKQKIVKISKDRLGTYFNQHIVRSLDLKSGEEVYVSVPDKKHIVISLEKDST